MSARSILGCFTAAIGINWRYYRGLSLLTFISKIAEGLWSTNKVPRGVGRPSKRKSTDDVPAAKEKSSQPLSCNYARYDGMHHWPENRSNKLNCRLCKVGNSRV